MKMKKKTVILMKKDKLDIIQITLVAVVDIMTRKIQVYCIVILEILSEETTIMKINIKNQKT